MMLHLHWAVSRKSGDAQRWHGQELQKHATVVGKRSSLPQKVLFQLETNSKRRCTKRQIVIIQLLVQGNAELPYLQSS